MEEAVATHRRERTSLGDCWVLKTMDLVDEVPEILASGMPVWLEDEWTALLRTSSQDERRRTWQRRAKAVADEIAFRSIRPGWTIYGNTPRKSPKAAPRASETGVDPTGGF